MAVDIDYTRRNKKPRLLTDAERDKLDEFIDAIHYSNRYNDDHYEYRHVQLPKQMLKVIPKDYFDGTRGTLKLLWEDEWRGLGITQARTICLFDYPHPVCPVCLHDPNAYDMMQSLGWEHYEVHEPEPHILLFKRPVQPGQ